MAGDTLNCAIQHGEVFVFAAILESNDRQDANHLASQWLTRLALKPVKDKTMSTKNPYESRPQQEVSDVGQRNPKRTEIMNS